MIMKQEEKEILLKDLCGRLSYGVKCSFWVNDDVYEITGINPTCCGASEIQATHIKSSINGDFRLNNCKPYLFPMSSMTVEQRCKVQNLLPNKCDISFKNQKITFYNEGESIELDKLEKLFNFFNLYHIDYRGLIPMGLAIDATGKNIYQL